jgi:ribonuclease HI/pterin-4a-carbinolamine dehydratase
MWKEKNNKLYKKYTFTDFAEAFSFMSGVADIAEEQGHHPEWKNIYNSVEFWLSSHDEGKVTQKDKDLAGAIDAAAKAFRAPSAQETKRIKPRQEKTPKKLRMFADGGSRGNPGPSATGYVLLDDDDQILHQSGEYLGITTNNQAEYQAVKLGLEKALSVGVVEVDVFLDSLLVVNQMKGIFKVKNRDLWPIHESIKELTVKFKKVTFTHVPREFNTLADAEVNKVLDAQHKK